MSDFRKNMRNFARRQFPVGTRVSTLKGRKDRRPFSGRVVKHSFWKDYPSVIVQKDNGQKVQCLMHNLELTETQSRVTHR